MNEPFALPAPAADVVSILAPERSYRSRLADWRAFAAAAGAGLAAVLGLAITVPHAGAGTLSDNFTTSHDYSTGNVAGTIWSGVANAAAR